jgi:hypothetical protein
LILAPTSARLALSPPDRVKHPSPFSVHAGWQSALQFILLCAEKRPAYAFSPIDGREKPLPILPLVPEKESGPLWRFMSMRERAAAAFTPQPMGERA